MSASENLSSDQFSDHRMSVSALKQLQLPNRIDPNSPGMEKLTSDIKARGVQRPLQVETTRAGQVLTDGHHRLLAAEKAGVREVPVRVYANTYGGRWAAIRALVEAEANK